MSQLNVDNINNRTGSSGGPNFPTGISVAVGQTAYIHGDLNVDGTQTVINTANLEIADKTVGIASTSTKLNDTDLNGAGIVIYGSGGDKTITWNNSNQRLQTNTNFGITGNANVSGVITATTFSGGGLGVGANDNVNTTGIVTASSFNGFNQLSAPFGTTIVTYEVKVASKVSGQHRYHGTGSALGYVVEGTQSPYITLTPGRTYRFDQGDGSNATHQIKFYLNADKTGLYEGGVTYNGTAGQAGAYTQIVVNDYTPTVLHYQCANHGYMGNAVNTSSNSSMSAQSGSVTAMAAASVDCSLGNYFTKTISGATTFTFDNPPASGVSYGFTLELTHTGGSGSITWPTPNVKWPGDAAPSLTDGKTSLLMFVTDDGGTRWRASSLADYTT